MENLEKKLLKELKDRNLSKGELNAVIDQLKNPDLSPKTYRHYWSHNHSKIAICSDFHIGSVYKNMSNLEDMFKRFKKDDVDAVYISGDISEGYNMRPGHSFICDLHGADAQIDGIVSQVPNINKPIYFITGDHDYSHFKRQQIDIGKHIEEKRDDMHYLGMFEANVYLGKNTKLRLKHPLGGVAYAYSHHLQKIIDRTKDDDKPDIFALGHYHKLLYVDYHGVHGFLAGTIQDQTEWMKGKNIEAMKGGWIVDVYMKRNGQIDKLEMKLLPYY